MFEINGSCDCPAAPSTVGNKRNYGVDLLRIVSMFYIVILHTLGHGGVLETAEIGSIQYQAAWFLEIWAYCAVDVFALISGYVSAEDKKVSKRFAGCIVLWIQVVLYSVIIVLACGLFWPDAVTKQDFIRAFFPLIYNNYWYFTAYTGVVCLMPFIAAAIRGLTDSQAKKLLIVLVAVFSCFDIVFKRLVPSNGYSFAWILILFIIGAIIKKCGIGKSWRTPYLIIGIILLNAVTWLWKIYGVETSFLSAHFDGDLLVSYYSPTVLVSSVLYLILFSKMSFGGAGKIVTALAAGTFSVYLINDNPCFRRCFMQGGFAALASGNVAALVLETMLFALLFLIAVLLIDIVRQKVFKLCRIRQAVGYAVEKTSSALGRIVNGARKI